MFLINNIITVGFKQVWPKKAIARPGNAQLQAILSGSPLICLQLKISNSL